MEEGKLAKAWGNLKERERIFPDFRTNFKIFESDLIKKFII